MANMFRARYPKMRTVDGKRIPVRGRNGRPHYSESRTWTIEYTDAKGHRQRVQGYTDKAATRQKMAEIEKNVDRQKAGVLDVSYDASKRPVGQHIDAWLADLERAGRSPDYIRVCKTRINKLADGLKWTDLLSIQPDALSAWLATVSASEKWADRTVNHYVDAGNRFCNWCVSMRRMERNPLSTVAKIAAPEASREGRAARVDELRRLLGYYPFSPSDRLSHGGSDGPATC